MTLDVCIIIMGNWRINSYYFIWIIILDMLVCLMIYWFYNTKKISGYLNVLYMVWILFATYLTIGIYVLN